MASSCAPLVTYPAPPAGFDPTGATSAQLAEYGFPPKPDAGASAEEQAEWTTAVTDAKTEVPPDPVCSDTTHAVNYSGGWAGHMIPNYDISGSPQFRWAESSWTQPSVPLNSNYTNYKEAPDASFWVGISSTKDNDDYLLQAGADSIALSSPAYKFWTEDYPGGTDWEGPSLSPGDDVYVYLDNARSGEEYYFLENESTGDYSPFTNPAPYYASGMGDFINERLQGYYLPNFGSAFVSGNYVGDGTSDWGLTGTDNDVCIMTTNGDADGTVESEPTSVASDTSFTHYWYTNPGPNVWNSCAN